MSSFNKYAEYYNLLYKDKDYLSEVNYIVDLFRKFSGKKVKTILDLGCGTGLHDSVLANKGFSITGVDLSERMIEIAQKSNTKNTQFMQADVRDFHLEQKFDAVISLFHVASYQTTNEDFEKYLKTAYNHLEEGGLFIFDFWYGPAVLTDRPSVRIKNIENEYTSITRISEPSLYPNDNIVDVKFNVLIENNLSNQLEKIEELHRMRYWFLPELLYFIKKSGFTFVNGFEWLTMKNLSFKSWNGVIIVEK